jgi:hypothetical protein
MLRAKLGRFREQVENFAEVNGWTKESNEGAFEFVQRISYEQGAIDTRAELEKQEPVAWQSKNDLGRWGDVSTLKPVSHSKRPTRPLYFAAGAKESLPDVCINTIILDDYKYATWYSESGISMYSIEEIKRTLEGANAQV